MDIEDYEEEMNTNKEFIEENIVKAADLSLIDKKQAINKINQNIKDLEMNTKGYKQKILEVAMPKSDEDEYIAKHQEYLDFVKDHKEKLAKLQMTLNSPSEEKDEDDDLIMKNGKIDYAKNTSEQVIQHGFKTQDKSKKAADRILGRTDEINKMADDQIQEMDRQEDVLLRINDANMEIESDMKRAQKYLKYFARTYMQDK